MATRAACSSIATATSSRLPDAIRSPKRNPFPATSPPTTCVTSWTAARAENCPTPTPRSPRFRYSRLCWPSSLTRSSGAFASTRCASKCCRYNVAVQTFSLEGKTALVAGASRGIGLAIARDMKAAGASVILAARSKDVLEVRAAELGGRALVMDVADSASIASAVNGLDAPDILVNVAGTNQRKKFEDYTPEEYQRIMDTNLNGIVRLTQLVGAKMVARAKGGKIINIGSLMSIRGLPYLSVYAITKVALSQPTNGLAT